MDAVEFQDWEIKHINSIRRLHILHNQNAYLLFTNFSRHTMFTITTWYLSIYYESKGLLNCVNNGINHAIWEGILSTTEQQTPGDFESDQQSVSDNIRFALLKQIVGGRLNAIGKGVRIKQVSVSNYKHFTI